MHFYMKVTLASDDTYPLKQGQVDEAVLKIKEAITQLGETVEEVRTTSTLVRQGDSVPVIQNVDIVITTPYSHYINGVPMLADSLPV